MLIDKHDKETLKEYKLRLFRNKDEYNLSNVEIAELINNASNSNKSESVYRKWYKAYNEGYEDAIRYNDNNNSATISTLEDLKYESEINKKKAQTERLETNKWLRNQARSEMIQERIVDAINSLKPFDYVSDFGYEDNNKVGVLCIADAHYGAIVNAHDIHGDNVNIYSPDVFKHRLHKLASYILNDVANFNYSKLIITDLGDNIQGILRMSDLSKLQTGVIDSVIQYAEYISGFLNVLSKGLCIPIEYICIGGNHDRQRYLNGKHNDFPSENMVKVVREFVYLRTKDNANIIVDDYAETNYRNIDGCNVMFYHGDGSKNDKEEISFWEDYNDIVIDVLILGHLHQFEYNSIGYGTNTEKCVIRCPSIIGIDDYSKQVRKLSRAGSLFLLFENGEITWMRKYDLN